MSDGGFLKRWSRRKRAQDPSAAEGAPPEAANSPPAPGAHGIDAAASPTAQPAPNPSSGSVPAPVAADEPIDPATLPPLESLGPESDYTVFLRKGVPEPLRVAALRKAWMSDPFIRDFRGPAEYALDYTTAEFDLRPSDDVAKMLDRIFPPQPTRAEPIAGANTPQPAQDVSLSPPKLPVPEPASRPERVPPMKADPPAAEAVARPVPEASPPRRRHGGALPEDAG